MSKKFSLLILLVVAVFNPPAAFAIPEKDTGNLGEIRQSILSPDAFKRIYGDGWVLMDGRALRDQDDLVKERLWTSKNIPDARGVFLRGKNFDRSVGEGDPRGDRPCGEYAEDQNKKHTHRDQGHGHSFTIYDSHGLGGRIAGSNDTKCQTLPPDNGISPGHANLEHEGGDEARPRCIVVNTYIKINRTPESAQTQILTETLASLPKRILENDGLRRVLREMIREEAQRFNTSAARAGNSR